MRPGAAEAEQFAAMGVRLAPELIADEEEGFEVMTGNWETVSAFLDCGGAWNAVFAPGAGIVRTGFDWAGVKAILDMTARAPAVLFPGLRIMEAAALAAFAEKR